MFFDQMKCRYNKNKIVCVLIRDSVLNGQMLQKCEVDIFTVQFIILA